MCVQFLMWIGIRLCVSFWWKISPAVQAILTAHSDFVYWEFFFSKANVPHFTWYYNKTLGSFCALFSLHNKLALLDLFSLCGWLPYIGVYKMRLAWLLPSKCVLGISFLLIYWLYFSWFVKDISKAHHYGSLVFNMHCFSQNNNGLGSNDDDSVTNVVIFIAPFLDCLSFFTQFSISSHYACLRSVGFLFSTSIYVLFMAGY